LERTLAHPTGRLFTFLVTAGFADEDAGARLRVTLQIAALADPSMAEEARGGRTKALDDLERLLAG